jgi:hypothetical protein
MDCILSILTGIDWLAVALLYLRSPDPAVVIQASFSEQVLPHSPQIQVTLSPDGFTFHTLASFEVCTSALPLFGWARWRSDAVA